jgi:HD superfamily phosphohydrolase
MERQNKKKMINDPVYGFLTLPSNLLYDLVEHKFFQRLRRIRQLGMGELVYPGATHTRFHHALGALQLMCKALDVLKQKGIEITEQEYEATCVAILLHDIGHGPYSHTLENAIIPNLPHEVLSQLMMQTLNIEFEGKLDMALRIFNNQYPKVFLHQLISSQLDMDRLDYLSRDSFYTGVHEGVVSAERIINMLSVAQNQLVVEEKGIYSIEKFIIARRLMYWQVYLHKTVLASEMLLRQVLKRAKWIMENGGELYATPFMQPFIESTPSIADFEENQEYWLDRFVNLDDSDILVCLKTWQYANDEILSFLCKSLIGRKLPKIVISENKISDQDIEDAKKSIAQKYDFINNEWEYFIQIGFVENHAYNQEYEGIKILRKNGEVCDVTDVSDNYNLTALKKTVRKNYMIRF